MTAPTTIPALARPEFFDGQKLEATDLNAVYDYHRELRWLHNRALHGWGVATGMVVSGEKGASTVAVTPGYAIDCTGHDIVLASAATLVLPAVGGTVSGAPQLYYLTVSWLADEEIPPDESRTGVCGAGGAVRRPELARLRFQDPADVTSADTAFRRGVDLVLATIQVKDCVLAAAPSTAERRDARPASRPTVAAGRTPSGATAWSFYPNAAAADGVRTVVDTSAAGFTRTPAYTAQVIGNRRLSASGPVLEGFVRIAHATPTGFTVQMELPRGLSVGSARMNPDSAFVSSTLDALERSLRWHVAWMGIEG